MTTQPVFPNEILDAIVDSAVENLSTRSVFDLTFTPQLVALLKQVALTSNYLRQRAQRYLFLEIRLHPFQKHKGGHEDYLPSMLDRFLSIFQDNPQLLEYPRSLAIMAHPEHWTSKFPPHFLSVVLPFFTNSLQQLDHLRIHVDFPSRWPGYPPEFKDAIVHCIKGNRLKSFKLRRLSLPKDFVYVLPSTLEACDIGVHAEDDPSFTAKYVKPQRTRGSDQAHSVKPAHLRISWLLEPPGWVQSQKDTFFQRVTSLNVGVVAIPTFTALMDRIPNTLTHLSLRHCESIQLLQDQHNALHETTFRPTPYLHELEVSVQIEESSRVVTCPSQAAMIAADYISPAYASIRVFRLTIEWRSFQELGEPRANRYMERAAGGFARLDDLLSDRSVLPSLNEVYFDIRPNFPEADWISDEQARELGGQIRSDALEVFHKTVDRVNTFGITSTKEEYELV
ncbi:hypothetical protein BKA70DRAFT_1416207 [Coprinopsis sp. MPI-PUGE-AT-0042]|nr:hypothetical protein BKA70DRAFT_1416207 [Coprinopsis sp. MPI-PUGE-AT-0042]